MQLTLLAVAAVRVQLLLDGARALLDGVPRGRLQLACARRLLYVAQARSA